MTFLEQRKPFYLENNTLNVIFPNQKYMNSSITEWFNGDKIPWLHTIRGYYMETEDDCYVMLYENNFNIYIFVYASVLFLGFETGKIRRTGFIQRYYKERKFACWYKY